MSWITSKRQVEIASLIENRIYKNGTYRNNYLDLVNRGFDINKSLDTFEKAEKLLGQSTSLNLAFAPYDTSCHAQNL